MEKDSFAQNVKEQYKKSNNLETRISLHEKYSVDNGGFDRMILSSYDWAPGARVLEIGCGTGDFWIGRQDLIDKCSELILADFSEGMVETSRRNLRDMHGIEFMVCDIQDLPFEDASFDVVIANMMLYHVPDLELALSEVRRVLKLGGTFYAATYGEKNIMPFVHNLLREYMQAPAFKRHFMLENAWEPLRRHFNDVRLNKYSDKLLITDMNDLADYVESLTGTSQISGVSRETMIKVFTDNCVDGVLTIPKEYGMFIGRA